MKSLQSSITLGFVSTLPASPTSVTPFKQIWFNEFMPALTPNFSYIFSGKTVTPKNVFFGRNRLKMGGVYATSISTKMVYLKPFQDFSLKKFIRDSVNILSFIFDLCLPVSLDFAARPVPTSFRFDNALSYNIPITHSFVLPQARTEVNL